MEARDLEIMIAQITRGDTKEQSRVTLDEEGSEIWDRLEVQIAEIKRDGFIVDTDSEIGTMVPLRPGDIVEPVE